MQLRITISLLFVRLLVMKIFGLTMLVFQMSDLKSEKNMRVNNKYILIAAMLAILFGPAAFCDVFDDVKNGATKITLPFNFTKHSSRGFKNIEFSQQHVLPNLRRLILSSKLDDKILGLKYW